LSASKALSLAWAKASTKAVHAASMRASSAPTSSTRTPLPSGVGLPWH
jgi:hypothetical protein